MRYDIVMKYLIFIFGILIKFKIIVRSQSSKIISWHFDHILIRKGDNLKDGNWKFAKMEVNISELISENFFYCLDWTPVLMQENGTGLKNQFIQEFIPG